TRARRRRPGGARGRGAARLPRRAAALRARAGRPPGPLSHRRCDGARRGDARAPRALPQRRGRLAPAHADRAHRPHRHAPRAPPGGGAGRVRGRAAPPSAPAAMAGRQDAAAWLAERDRLRARLRQALRPVRDLERLLAKAARPAAVPRDLAALRDALEALPEAAGVLDEAPPAARPALLRAPAPVPEVAAHLREALVDAPPALPRGSRGAGETGYVRAGFHAELDALREAVAKGREWIAGLEARERERSGIANLKILFHPVHGYAIEVTKAQLARIPGDYERKQTLASAERFTTPELRQREQAVVGARERAASLEREILESVRRVALDHAARISAAADAVARPHVLASLAEGARQGAAGRAPGDASGELEIRGGRHPVVEALLAAQGEEFVPNDAVLSEAGARILVLTGPNMSGKSTYLRQVAQIALLAQIGSSVPAESARLGVV